MDICYIYVVGERLRGLEFENRRLSESVQSYVDDVNSIRSSYNRPVRCTTIFVAAYLTTT